MKMYAMYREFSGSHYDDGGTDTNKTLLAIDYTIKALRERWNNKVKADKRRHEKLPLFKTGRELNYNGSTGGGYAFVSCRITIEEYKPWDNDLKPKLAESIPTEEEIRTAVFTEIFKAIRDEIDSLVYERDDCGNDIIKVSNSREYKRYTEAEFALCNLFSEFDDIQSDNLRRKPIKRKDV